MADVTGPISSLPGASFAPEGMCDLHPDRPATARVQGETDSFGCEMHDMCDECAKEHRAEMRTPDLGRCDWCSKEDVERRPKRDYDEGMSGPVYYVCKPCADRYDEQAALDDWSDDRDDYCDRCGNTGELDCHCGGDLLHCSQSRIWLIEKPTRVVTPVARKGL